ncbi:MAG: succinyl-CoA synthetase subunit beta [Gracilibacteraceae bacterium]|jgi:succinyl-CoA synthetase beta subunit|nr:succinyl-CoA synthetase subunit beta [Gracilibacteraceae bacterium]
MAKLFEFQGKHWLSLAGLPVPAGQAVDSAVAAGSAARRLYKPAAVKGQVQSGGRSKAGIVRLVNTPAEAEKAAAAILARAVNGLPVRRILVEEKLDIVKEYYCAVVLNSARTARSPMLMFSPDGGVDIESVPENRIWRRNIDPIFGLRPYEAAELCRQAGVPAAETAALAELLVKLAVAYSGYDCQTIEVNPLALTTAGRFYCADCKMDIDNSAVYRQPQFGIKIARDLPGEPTELDKIGWEIEEDDSRGTGFLMSMRQAEKSCGLIGYHPIGGGSAMMGLDALNRVGLKPANYADTSGNPVAAKIYRVAKCVLAQPKIEGYLLGGFMMANQEQWHHAHALVKVLREILPLKPGLPCVLLLCGNREDESLHILREGLKDLMRPDCPGQRIEIYGRDYVTDTEFIGNRLLSLCLEYRRERSAAGKQV